MYVWIVQISCRYFDGLFFTNITAGERKVPVHLYKKGAALCWNPEVAFIKHFRWHAWPLSHGRGFTSNIYRNRKHSTINSLRHQFWPIFYLSQVHSDVLLTLCICYETRINGKLKLEQKYYVSHKPNDKQTDQTTEIVRETPTLKEKLLVWNQEDVTWKRHSTSRTCIRYFYFTGRIMACRLRGSWRRAVMLLTSAWWHGRRRTLCWNWTYPTLHAVMWFGDFPQVLT